MPESERFEVDLRHASNSLSADSDPKTIDEFFVNAARYRSSFARVTGSGRPVTGSFCFF